MTDILRVSIVQTELAWQAPETNRQMLSNVMEPLQGATDLIVLPEMFTTGFMMSPETMAEPMEGETLPWLKQQAHELGAAICGSVAIKEDGAYVNRFLFVTSEGEVAYYDKRHLFRMGNEHEHFNAGTSRSLIEYRGWRILPSICYDLRFPVFLRNRNDYDLMINVANWPGARRNPWRTLLQARAIENYAYVVGVNRIGSDAAGLHYTGDSIAVDFKGELVCDHPVDQAFVETVALDRAALQQFRDKFPVWQDADDFDLGLP
ncbi:amidohydrolase [Neptunomonas marina]|uniref:Omega-amidase YafV n=1 Tax=Neptunomonas marina TaxID=1815562 RepID=A0A437Q4Z6_9GAMM|nr:amidohydrolase [Neptunomonas marina]RVU29576.1 amidohydrolase [Neptunomonas marina]